MLWCLFWIRDLSVSLDKQGGYCYINSPCIHSANRRQQMVPFSAAWMEQTGGALSHMHSEQSETLRCGPGWVIFRLFGRKEVTGERKGMWKIGEKRRRTKKQGESNETGKDTLHNVRQTIYIESANFLKSRYLILHVFTYLLTLACFLHTVIKVKPMHF